MDYQGNVIRPPSEARSIILQVTVGCSHNKCTFCGAYKDQRFAIKPDHVIESDLDYAARHYSQSNRIFLADGDVLILPQKRLVSLLVSIRKKLSGVRRIRLYGNAKSIRTKSLDELIELKALGLDRIYMGLESGCDTVLQNIRKNDTSKGMIAAAQAVKDAGLFLSVTALLGLGGKEYSLQHSLDTARTLNSMQPNQIAVLTLMILENTPLAQDVKSGTFKLLSPVDILKELYHLVENLNGVRCQFHANHASSYLPLAGRLPKDHQFLLDQISMAIEGSITTTPEHRRAL